MDLLQHELTSFINELIALTNVMSYIILEELEECWICYTAIPKRQVIKCSNPQCNAIYHDLCIEKWYSYMITCPYCHAPHRRSFISLIRCNWRRCCVWF